jgi:two-component system, cell cycle sensor histidine kinase and response regulator CckA
MTNPLHLLLVEDSASDAKLVVNELQRSGRSIVYERVESETTMRTALANGRWDAVISEWSMPEYSALAVLGVVKELCGGLPVVIVSRTAGADCAVEAMRAGASDYVLKDKLGRLVPTLERALREFTAGPIKRRLAKAVCSCSGDALHKSEKQLWQAQKMEALGRLAGGVAHDFNNALSVMLNHSALALRGLEPGSPARRHIEQVCQAAESAAGLTRRLLMCSRQRAVAPPVIDLRDTVTSMEPIVRRVLGEQVELLTKVSSERSCVKVDRAQIEQVIMNLAVNARDAMPRGGKLVVEVQNVVLDEVHASQHGSTKPGPYAILKVRDSGIGMDRETQQRIFEPFFTTKPVGNGSGLGLFTVFGTVQQSGGSIWLHSEPGAGTTFKVFLPRVGAEVELAERRSVPATLRGHETILLVEDEESLREVVSQILEDQGYQVFVAAHGAQALERASAHQGRIDLLLSDVVMPQIGGPELAKRLLLQRPDIKLLFMSGFTDDRIAHEGVLHAGVFIQKPFTATQLTGKVRTLLDARLVDGWRGGRRVPSAQAVEQSAVDWHEDVGALGSTVEP